MAAARWIAAFLPALLPLATSVAASERLIALDVNPPNVLYEIDPATRAAALLTALSQGFRRRAWDF